MTVQNVQYIQSLPSQMRLSEEFDAQIKLQRRD